MRAPHILTLVHAGVRFAADSRWRETGAGGGSDGCCRRQNDDCPISPYITSLNSRNWKIAIKKYSFLSISGKAEIVIIVTTHAQLL
jgi:hypothetical protein